MTGKRTAAFLLSILMLLPTLTACTGTRSKTASTTFTVMCWNEDFRRYVERYFIPTHQALMTNVEIDWVITEINGYKKSVENSLDEGKGIDLFLADDTMVTSFANNDKVASLSTLGIFDKDMSEQLPYTRVMARSSDGVQKGSAFSAEPGIIVYRTDYAEKYLGITNREEMQAQLSSWDGFLACAKKLEAKSKGKIKMITNSSELWMSVSAAMSGHWITEGRLSVSDEVLTSWMQYIADLGKCNAFRSSKLYSDDWYDAVNDGVFCYFSAPWLNKNVSSFNSDINTIFSAAKNDKSFGKWEASPAPNGFAYGGNWLFSSTDSKHKDIACEIIKAFSCDSKFMTRLALGELCYVNNTAAIQKASEANIVNPMFVNADAFSIYTPSAQSLELSPQSVYDAEISKLLYNQAVRYKNKEIVIEEAIYNFKYNVWKKHDDLLDKPTPPVIKH